MLYAIVEQVLQKTLDSWDGYKDMYLGEERNNLNRMMISLLNPLWHWWRDNRISKKIYGNSTIYANNDYSVFKIFLENFFKLEIPDEMLMACLGRSPR